MTMTNQVVWHGSQQESFDLINAIARNCTCEFGMMGVRLSTCPAHLMLMEDQRALDGLLFVRHMLDRLQDEEFERPIPRQRTPVLSLDEAREQRTPRALAG
jgi:hypothetical protein